MATEPFCQTLWLLRDGAALPRYHREQLRWYQGRRATSSPQGTVCTCCGCCVVLISTIPHSPTDSTQGWKPERIRAAAKAKQRRQTQQHAKSTNRKMRNATLQLSATPPRFVLTVWGAPAAPGVTVHASAVPQCPRATGDIYRWGPLPSMASHGAMRTQAWDWEGAWQTHECITILALRLRRHLSTPPRCDSAPELRGTMACATGSTRKERSKLRRAQ
jgi:hypothetical protein